MKIEKIKEFVREKEKSRTLLQRIKYFLEIIKESSKKENYRFIEMNDRIVIGGIPFLIENGKSPESIDEIEKILFDYKCDFIVNLTSEFGYIPLYDEDYILFINEGEGEDLIEGKFLDHGIKGNKGFFRRERLDELYSLYKSGKKLYLGSSSDLQRSIFVFEYLMKLDGNSEKDIEDMKEIISNKFENSKKMKKILNLKFFF